MYLVTPAADSPGRTDIWESTLASPRTGRLTGVADAVRAFADAPRVWWTTVEDDSCDAARTVLAAVLDGVQLADLVFRHKVVQASGADQIVRKTFGTPGDVVVFHTRRAVEGTDVSVQLVAAGTCLRLFHDPKTGAVKVTGSVDAPF